jgi:hypothetical protein
MMIVSFNDSALVIDGAENLRKYMSRQFRTRYPQSALAARRDVQHIVSLDGDRATAETSSVTYLATLKKDAHPRRALCDKFSQDRREMARSQTTAAVADGRPGTSPLLV